MVPAVTAHFSSTLGNWTGHELFRGMDHEVLQELCNGMERIQLEPGDVFVRQGEPGEDMFLVQSGRVRIRVTEKDGTVRFETVLDAPQVVGEMALITREPRSATCIAETHVAALRVDKPSFQQMIRKNPGAAVFLTRAVGKRLLDANTIQRVGKYKVLGRLGKGGMATVFEAVHPELGQHVALKMLSHDVVLFRGFASSFKREALLIAKLNHPHIVKVMDVESGYGTHFIVMERLTGSELSDVIESGDRLPYPVVRRILTELCDALHYCHENGLLHCDVKPANIFLTENRSAKLLDFNIATEEGTRQQQADGVAGTPNYMAPEQVRGDVLDARTDLYCLGMSAFELVTGVVPFHDAETLEELHQMHLSRPTPDPRDYDPNLSADLREFILRATAKDPDDRFGSCADAAKFLRLAVELPIVEKLDMTTIAISYHPSRRDFVREKVRQLHEDLAGVSGVALVYGNQVAAADEERK